MEIFAIIWQSILKILTWNNKLGNLKRIINGPNFFHDSSMPLFFIKMKSILIIHTLQILDQQFQLWLARSYFCATRPNFKNSNFVIRSKIFKKLFRTAKFRYDGC